MCDHSMALSKYLMNYKTSGKMYQRKMRINFLITYFAPFSGTSYIIPDVL